jgi:hypothetical protein
MVNKNTLKSRKRRARIRRENQIRNFGVALEDLGTLEEIVWAIRMRPEDWALLKPATSEDFERWEPEPDQGARGAGKDPQRDPRRPRAGRGLLQRAFRHE